MGRGGRRRAGGGRALPVFVAGCELHGTSGEIGTFLLASNEELQSESRGN